MTLVFGSSTASFTNHATGQDDSQQFTRNINHLILYFVYLFVARFVIGYVATLCICTAAARTTCALRKAFLDKLLRQEISHFDKEGSGSAATQVTTSRCSSNLTIALYVLLT
jgi:ATP-binding cassette subfamily B (MDR/TAP) protein 1